MITFLKKLRSIHTGRCDEKIAEARNITQDYIALHRDVNAELDRYKELHKEIAEHLTMALSHNQELKAMYHYQTADLEETIKKLEQEIASLRFPRKEVKFKKEKVDETL